MSNYGLFQYTAVGFRETLSAANQNRVLGYPIAQSKNDLNNKQTT